MKKISNSVSLFWYRRLAEWAVGLGILLVGLFLADSFSALGAAYDLSPFVVLGAALGGLLGMTLRFLQPKRLNLLSWVLFLANSITAFAAVKTTGELSSPLVALWLVAALASGIVGLGGILIFFLFNTGYFWLATQQGWWDHPAGQLILIFAMLQVPVLVSLLLWRAGLFTPRQRDETISHLSARLSREASKSEIIIQAIADGVMVISDEKVVQLINSAAQAITGWEEGEALELDYRSILKLTNGQDQPLEANDPIQAVLTTHKNSLDNNLTLTTKAGKKVFLSLVASPMTTEDGRVGAIAVFRDITKEKAEEQEKAEFISTASHEMRTPVAAIEGYLALAMNPNVAQIDEKAKMLLDKAHQSTQHLGRLFQDLLTISKAEDGRLPNKPKVIEIVSFVEKIWEAQSAKATAKKLEYAFIPKEGRTLDATKVIKPIFYAQIDPDRLQEVVNNLIDNAIKYTNEGEVAVDVTADQEEVTISVKDSGIGIAKEDISHLFQKFYRVDNSYTRQIGGTGLGLYISRRIVEQTGGQIWVESELGKGSTFFVQIPRIDSEKAAFLRQQQQLAPTQEAITGAPRTIKTGVAEPSEQPPAQKS